MEQLEPRLTLSLIMGDLGASNARAPSTPPPIRLDLVALHELGHALGLDHDSTDTVSIMDPYYNASYDPDVSFATDPAVAKLLKIYADVNTSGWNTTNDADEKGESTPDTNIDLTYSFMAGGLRMDGGKPVYSTAIPEDWLNIIEGQLARWEDVSAGKLSFTPHIDGAYAFNAAGKAQNDSRFGDIRIAAHYFDGPSKVLAHTYFPPPNGSTAAGDAHFDNSEKWVQASGAGLVPLSPSTATSGGTTGSSAKSNSSQILRGSDLAYLEAAFAVQTASPATVNDSRFAAAPGVPSELQVSPPARPLSVRGFAIALPMGAASTTPAITEVGLGGKRSAGNYLRVAAANETSDDSEHDRLAELHDLFFKHYAN